MPAVLHGDVLIHSYGQLAARSASLGGAIRDQLGLRVGDRIALFMTNRPEYLEILYGVWWAGLVVVPVNAKLHPRELRTILEDSCSSCLFVSEDLAETTMQWTLDLANLQQRIVIGSNSYSSLFNSEPADLVHREPDDLAWLFYTSGTTGRPKGVMQTHRNLLSMTECYFSDVDSVEEHDAIVYAAPMSHGAGMYNFAHVLKGTRHVIPKSGGFDVQELCTLSKSIGRLSMFAAPTMVKRLVEHIETSGTDPTGFKTIVYGGGPMYVQDIEHALRVMGPRFVQIYGQGECPMTITALSREELAQGSHPNWMQRVASVGKPQSVVEVRIADSRGDSLPIDELGEILVRGDPVMLGYWNNPQATSEVIRDGWLWTGDMGVMDCWGFITLKDRSKDVIISGGSNIYPREVEEVLLQHANVREVAVIGVPDPEWGEIVVACVVGYVDPVELDALCRGNLARFKRPKLYRFLPTLPKNNYGKVLKTALRAG